MLEATDIVAKTKFTHLGNDKGRGQVIDAVIENLGQRVAQIRSNDQLPGDPTQDDPPPPTPQGTPVPQGPPDPQGRPIRRWPKEIAGMQ